MRKEELYLKTDDQFYYYVSVQFKENNASNSYICPDLSVKVGDEVLVPVYENKEMIGKVVSAMFCTADDAPYPIEKTKTVIRKIITDEQKELFQRLAFDLNAVKKQICGEFIGEKYGTTLIHAHHIDYFTHSLNNNPNNILIVCPNHHGIIHSCNPEFDFAEKTFKYANGYVEGLKMNKHI